MSELSDKGISILRRIHNEGMLVLSSFMRKNPYYGHDFYNSYEDMPLSDWNVCNQELWTIERKTVYPNPIECGRVITRVYITSGRKFTDTTDAIGEDEMIISHEEDMDFWHVGGANGIISETIQIDYGNLEAYTYDEFLSDYLIINTVEMSDSFEENVGLIRRYSLTEKALNLIGANSMSDN